MYVLVYKCIHSSEKKYAQKRRMFGWLADFIITHCIKMPKAASLKIPMIPFLLIKYVHMYIHKYIQ